MNNNNDFGFLKGLNESLQRHSVRLDIYLHLKIKKKKLLLELGFRDSLVT